ncbi:MAG: NAD(P)/FAD-dependent oxidoreductase [Euryarchaeota archaeon]|nr:NAD(P)/FAD-dependent oxidoreductase [Euryarchaeota archaeon]
MTGGGVWDAVVAGAGPAGSVAARELARRGHSVLVLEEHHEVGRPVQCAGLVTRRVFDAVPAPECVQNSLTGGELLAPTGRSITLRAPVEKAVVIDRARFDRRAAEMAIDAGARLELGTRVIGVSGHEGGEPAVVEVSSRGGRRSLRARVVVGADGVQSSVGRSAGLQPPGELLPGFEAGLCGVEGPGDTVRILVGREVAPGFFAWLIPSGEGRAVLGLCCEPGPVPAREYLGRLLGNPLLSPYIRRARVTGYCCGSVPVSPVRRSVSGRVALLGDAAGQVKPISGGGVFTATRCALACAGAASAAIGAGGRRLSLDAYERGWRAELGRELRFGRRLRRAFVNVTDRQMDELVRMLDRPALLALISARGDLDFPSKLAKLLFRQAPGLLKFSGAFIKSLF